MIINIISIISTSIIILLPGGHKRSQDVNQPHPRYHYDYSYSYYPGYYYDYSDYYGYDWWDYYFGDDCETVCNERRNEAATAGNN